MTPSDAACSLWRLYVIVDRASVGARDLTAVAAAAIRGGADALQLRDKAASARELAAQAERLLAITRPAGIPLLINDQVEVARSVGADGVHVGQDDGPIREARHLLGPGRLIGRSTHSLAQALQAEAEGADYIGLGPIYPTPTKPTYEPLGIDVMARVLPKVRVPVVCIGGIDRTVIHEVLRAGARCVAVVRAVCAAEDPEAAARNLKQQFSCTSRAASRYNRDLHPRVQPSA